MSKATTNGKTSSVLNDRIFKYVFSNTVALEDLVKSIFEYLEIDEPIKIRELIPQSLIQSNHIKNKDFYGDLVAKLKNGNLINLEVYTSFNKYDFDKSFGYLCRLYSNQMKYGSKDYHKCKKVYSINIVNSFKNFEEEAYNIKYIKNLRVMECGDIHMIFIALDEFKNDKGYDKRMIKWIKWLMTKDEKKKKEISNETMEITSNALLEFMKTQPKTLEEYYEGKLEEEKCRFAYMQEEYVIAMLQKDLPIETISDITTLSKDKIKEIADENGFELDDK